MLIILRMNRHFMEFMRAEYPDVCKVLTSQKFGKSVVQAEEEGAYVPIAAAIVGAVATGAGGALALLRTCSQTPVCACTVANMLFTNVVRVHGRTEGGGNCVHT